MLEKLRECSPVERRQHDEDLREKRRWVRLREEKEKINKLSENVARKKSVTLRRGGNAPELELPKKRRWLALLHPLPERLAQPSWPSPKPKGEVDESPERV